MGLVVDGSQGFCGEMVDGPLWWQQPKATCGLFEFSEDMAVFQGKVLQEYFQGGPQEEGSAASQNHEDIPRCQRAERLRWDFGATLYSVVCLVGC